VSQSYGGFGLANGLARRRNGRDERDALGWYHEQRDAVRAIGLGPAHYWSSHGADAFGLMSVGYQEPVAKPRIRYSNRGIV
jgi:phage terminase large subunit